MKKVNSLVLLAAFLLLLLTGCNSSQDNFESAPASADPVNTNPAGAGPTSTPLAGPAADTGATTNANPDEITTVAAGELNLETSLIMGTVLLEESTYAVDAEQAAALLPLWKALRSLSSSETAAQVEIDAVIAQIEETMTTEQLAAIAAMQLSMQDMPAVSEILGIEETGGGNRSGELTPEMQATQQAARESGAAPGSGMGPGGGLGTGGGTGPGGGEFANLTPEEREAIQAERGGMRGARLGVNTGLLDGLIEFLTAKTQ
ncbi:MAG: hypothetical protein JW862_00870 [Anaerolineales bacterium]|nr:hypothetical protein [Anaerolineales bacterium]